MYAIQIVCSLDCFSKQVSIPSQRRYVGYWEKLLSFPRGINLGFPIVSLPKPCSRELQRIRLYDAVNIEQIFVVVSELQGVRNLARSKFCSPGYVKVLFCTKNVIFTSVCRFLGSGTPPQQKSPRVVAEKSEKIVIDLLYLDIITPLLSPKKEMKK